MIRFIGILIALAVIVAGSFEWENANFWAPGPSAAGAATETVVLIKPGVGLKGIADALAGAGVVKDGDLFQFGVRLRRATEKLRAGEYAIPSRASMHDILD